MRSFVRRLVTPVLTILSLALLILGCGDNLHQAGEAEITSFTILGHGGVIRGSDITVTLPDGTNVTSLTPTISFIGHDLSPSSGEAQDFTSPVTYTVRNDDGSVTRTYHATVVVGGTNLSTAKAITAFSFDSTNNAGLSTDVTATITGNDITAVVPSGTTVTALVASFTTTGKSVKVGTTTQTSGLTANDFTGPVDYVVTAEDGSTQAYTVTVTIAADNAKAITAFSFDMANNSQLQANVIANISGTTITATVPFGTTLTALVASFTSTGVSVKVGGTVQVSGTTANNFTSMVTYTVTAADASTQDYHVIVTAAPNNANDLLTFKFLSADNNPALTANVTGTINGQTVTVVVPNGTNLSALVASFTINGASVNIGGVPQTSGTTPNNFTNSVTTPIVYTVVAADGTPKNYSVSVNNSNPGDKQINSFVAAGVSGSFNGQNIDVVVPSTTDLTQIAPVVGFTGVSLTPASGAIVDFSNSATTRVTYTVFAADNTSLDYFVKITKAVSSSKEITRFTIQGLEGTITNVGSMNGTVTLTMPKGTDLSALTPAIEINGVSVSPAPGEIQDFSNGPVTYTVTAADNSTRTYTVSVDTVNGTGTKVITSFTITVGGVTYTAAITNGTNNGTITLVLPAGTDLSFQTPTIVINGSSITPPSFVPQDFSSPVTYVVTASDGSKRTYTTNITVAP